MAADMNAIINPKISVVMSVYNSAAFLVEAIESVLKQTFSDFEFIIINDGSSDETETIISSFNDNRIVHVNNDGNKGLIYSLNYGISISRSQYIARMDADDICDKTRFEKQIREFEKNNQLVICGSLIKTFGDGKNFVSHMPITHEEIISSILFICPFAHPSVMIRKDALLKLDFIYREDFKHSEDYDLWSRLVFTGNCKNIPEYLLKYRVHGAQASILHKEQNHKNVIKIQSNILKSFDFTPSPDESTILLNIFKGISRKNKNYLMETGALINKLYNLFSKKYPQYGETHAQMLVSRWFKICGNSGLGITNVKNAFNLSFFKIKYLKFTDLIKLIYKTCINYQQLEK